MGERLDRCDASGAGTALDRVNVAKDQREVLGAPTAVIGDEQLERITHCAEALLGLLAEGREELLAQLFLPLLGHG